MTTRSTARWLQPITGRFALVPRTAPVVLNALALDCSGSMRAHGQAPRRAINASIRDLADVDHARHYVGIVGFSDAPRVLLPVTPCEGTRLESYMAQGNTALYRTVADLLEYCLATVEQTPPELLDWFAIQVGVFSDGKDNKSPFDQPRVRALAAEALECPQIDLMTYGIGISAVALAERLGFPVDAASVQTVSASRAGVHQATADFTQTSTVRFSQADIDWVQRQARRHNSDSTPTPPA